jgi:RNA polymerase sigma-70 factor (ECF subfamily)
MLTTVCGLVVHRHTAVAVSSTSTRASAEMRRWRQQPAAAFVRATQEQVYRFLRYMVDADEVNDLTQATYVRAMRAVPGLPCRL